MIFSVLLVESFSLIYQAYRPEIFFQVPQLIIGEPKTFPSPMIPDESRKINQKHEHPGTNAQ